MLKKVWCDCHTIMIKLKRIINDICNMSDDEFTTLINTIEDKKVLDLALFIRYKKG